MCFKQGSFEQFDILKQELANMSLWSNLTYCLSCKQSFIGHSHIQFLYILNGCV